MNIKSIASHWISNIVTVLIPILIIPFLIKNIGVSAYGDIAYIQAISMAILVITDFGMNSVGPKILAENRVGVGNTEIVSSMMMLHFLVWTVSTSVGVLFIKLYTPVNAVCFFLSQMAVVFNYIPAPYVAIFFGRQLEYGVINTGTRIIFAFAVIFVINAGGGAYEYFLCNAIVSFLASALSSFFVWRTINGRLEKIKYDKLLFCGKEGFSQIIRRASNLPIILIVPALVRHVAGAEGVAIYSLTEKIRVVTWQGANPIIAFFSRDIFSENMYGDSGKKCVTALLAMAIVMAFVGIIFSGLIIDKFGMESVHGSKLVWMVGSVFIPVGVIFAYSMSVLMPKIGAEKIKAVYFWVMGFISVLAAYVFMSINPAAVGVFAMTLFEVMASAYIFLCALKVKGR